jgi:HAD superfamily hydrolase (TIGR01450 family)
VSVEAGAGGGAVPWRSRPAGDAPAALLLDLDGVVVTGERAIPGAAPAVARARRAGVPVRFVTNNASRAPDEVAALLVAAGVAATADEVVTSAVVAVDLVRDRLAARPGPHGPVAVVGGSGLGAPLAAAGLPAAPAADVPAGAAAALVQGFSPDVGWRDLAAAARHVRAGTWWVATNLDPTLPTEDGPAPGNGSLVQAVRAAAGRGPDEVAGKPDPVMIRRAVPRGLPGGAAGVVVVGDRLDTDVAAARAAGATAALVLTGVHGVEDLLQAPGPARPHLLVPDLSAVAAEHPAVRLLAPGEATCRRARAVVTSTPGGADLLLGASAGGAGDPPVDALDLVRALCTAVWSVADELPADRRAALVRAVVAHPAAAPALACGRASSRVGAG